MIIKGVKVDKAGDFILPNLKLDSKKDADILALHSLDPGAFERAMVMYAKHIILDNIESGLAPWDRAGMKEVVDKLEKWHKSGEHLISDETIQALKEWMVE